MKLDKPLAFPKGFLWGTAACAHQAEGGNTLNDWWDFEQQPGRILDGHKSGKCNNHYELFESDFKLLRSLNNNAHRMGIEWSRIFPDEDRINKNEIDHYKKVLDAAAANSLTLFVTTHHFSSPLWFAKKGGFVEEKNLDHFKRYIEVIAKELGSRVKFWNTINEPAVYSFVGWLGGEFPPGHKNIAEAFKVLRNIILAHGIAYNGLKEHGGKDSKIGLVKNIPHFVPLDPNNQLDIENAKSHDGIFNEYHLRAVEEGVLSLGGNDEHVPWLKGTADFWGINYYNQTICDHKNPLTPQMAREGDPVSQMGWAIQPDGLHASIMRLKKYGRPIYVTENGTATLDENWRIDYLARHFAAVHRAIADGADVRGYFHWTSIDNFEWAKGWMPRFGLIAFDPKTFERTVKRGGRFFADVAGANALTPEILKKYSS